MMKTLRLFVLGFILTSFLAADLFAQQQVTIRELNTYDTPLLSQDDLPNHPLRGVPVTFDAVVVSYPRSSGLASITDAGVPGRIHVFVADVNSITDGLDGNSMQIVVAGAQRETLEALGRGDVISVTGELTFFNNVGQFNADDIEFLGSVIDEEYQELEQLLQPTVISASELNIASEVEPGTFRWNAENYTKYIFRYVQIDGAEVIDRLEADAGRPWVIAAQDNSIVTSNDTSLRFRNDRNNYAFDPETGVGLGYNYRRPDVDGPYVPPTNGSVVRWSGFPVVNTFNPGNLEESIDQSTLKIAYFEDGFVWIADGDDPANRIAPEGWPVDLQVLGFAPTIDNLVITPAAPTGGQSVSVSVDVLLPEEDYTLESVTIEYSIFEYTEDGGEVITAAMSGSGVNRTFDFGSVEEFNSIEFTITAVANTPDGVSTTASVSESVFVGSTTQTSPALFSPAAGEYVNNVNVTLASATDGAEIYFTTDGSEPTQSSTLYTGPINVTQNTTINAIAFSDGLSASPVNTRTYTIEEEFETAATLAELRMGETDGTLYNFTGTAVITHFRNNRNQKYIQDATAGVLIDDAPGVITQFYDRGTTISNVFGTLGLFQGGLQYVPQQDPGAPGQSQSITPVMTTLAGIDGAFESMLVRVEDVQFVESGPFEVNNTYNLIDPSLGEDETFPFRTLFGEADYIGTEIPTGTFTLTALVNNFNGTFRVVARDIEDLGGTPSNTRDNERPVAFKLDQNYPNPFNPTTNIRYSIPEAANVTLSVYDVLGRRVAVLVNEQQVAGQYTINFDASRLASGTYLYRLDAGSFVQTKKMLLIK
ncbi:MAG: chitobiase/beta-hexosaminidase C-terminal domain-containing protein [Balneolales bacterium]|nr:chitobiase/beta-hexosaminidase C-terminal domain-containing protein [Balneolales bacterium]